MIVINLDFIKSPRFWKLFLVGLSAFVAGINQGLTWEQALFISLGIWLGGSTVVRTVDKFGESVKG